MMSSGATRGAMAVAAIGSSLNAGVFLGFSALVLPGLKKLRPEEATRAMRAIDAAVAKSGYLPLFFGTAIAAGVACYGATRGEGPSAGLALGATLAYGLGVVGVTALGNVPLNRALARGSPWASVASRWSVWNGLRSVAALGAAASFSWLLLSRS